MLVDIILIIFSMIIGLLGLVCVYSDNYFKYLVSDKNNNNELNILIVCMVWLRVVVVIFYSIILICLAGLFLSQCNQE